MKTVIMIIAIWLSSISICHADEFYVYEVICDDHIYQYAHQFEMYDEFACFLYINFHLKYFKSF